MKHLLLLIVPILILAANTSLARENPPTSEIKAPRSKAPQENRMRSLSQKVVFPESNLFAFLITPSIEVANIQYTARSQGARTTVSREFTTARYRLSGVKALGSSDWAVEASSFVANGTSNVTRDGRSQKFEFSGTGDITLGAKRLIPVSSGNLYAGVEADLSTTDAEAATLDRTGNFASGGHTVRPVLALELKTPYGAAGALASYGIRGPHRSVTKSRTGSSTIETEFGGNRLDFSVFTEFSRPRFALGALAGFSSSESGWVDTSDGRYDYQPSTHATAELYGMARITESFSLVPNFSYDTLLNRDLNGLAYTRYDNWTATVNARVTL